MAQAAATLTPSSPIMAPIQVHGVAKMPARGAPNLSEHADEIRSELGFDSKGIEGLRAKVRAG
jgi:crotonobetainyl-CoA:carnitine CoA-transferase CaiB-like acyl-CoA transferase